MEFIEIGKITKTHALKGELSVATSSDFIEERFKIGAFLYVKENGEMSELVVTSVCSHRNKILITVNNLNDINLVTHLVGLTLYGKRDQMPDLDEDEYHFLDLIGLEVYATTNEYIGKITDVLEYPHGSILEVYNEDKKILIPFVDAFIKDVTDERVIVELIEGLI